MENAVELIHSLSDVQAVSLLQRLNKDFYSAVPYGDVQRAAIPEARASLEVDAQTRKQSLSPEASVQAARMLLTALARDPDLAPAVVQAWDDVREDHKLFVETVLAVGLVVNLTMFMATSEMEFKIGKLRVKKKTASAKLIKELVAPLTELMKKFTPG